MISREVVLAAIYTAVGAAFIVGGAYLGLTLARLVVPGMG